MPNNIPIEQRLEKFFAGLRPVVCIAREAQAKLDRYAATGFSVFQYFRKDEKALSDIFADLLDSTGSHGQGDRFLRFFLEPMDLAPRPVDLSACLVHREYTTDKRRTDGKGRIDIVLEFLPEPRVLIGIENKPWQPDDKEQLTDYADDLSKRAKDNWALLYLSGDGSDPDPVSLWPETRKKYECERRFRTVPYRTPSAVDTCLVESWLKQCLKDCEAERVRWFLKDCVDFIRQQFSVLETCDDGEKRQ